MSGFLVWEPMACDEADAIHVLGVEDAEEAAVQYAERDYEKNGCGDGYEYAVKVRCPGGELVEVDISADFDPCFYAKSVRP